MSSDKLDDAIQLIKSGNKPAAVLLLKEVLRANPRDEDAWLWLYSCVEILFPDLLDSSCGYFHIPGNLACCHPLLLFANNPVDFHLFNFIFRTSNPELK